MKSFLLTVMMGVLLLCLILAAAGCGATSPDYAAPAYGCAILLTLLWSVRLMAGREASFVRSPMHVPVTAFTVYAVARYFSAPIEYPARQELLQIGLCVLIYFLCACNFYRHRDRTIILMTLMGLAALESAYGLWQSATGSDVVFHLHRGSGDRRASGTFISPNHLAGFLEIVFVLIIARIAVYRSPHHSPVESIVHKGIAGYVALIILAGLIAASSRGAWMALTLSLVVLGLWAWGKRQVTWRGMAWAASIALVIALVVWSVPSVRRKLGSVVSERIASTITMSPTDMPVGLNTANLEGRALMWRPTLKIIRDHPFIGSGPGSWMWIHLRYRDPRLQIRPEHAHNDILQLASDYGLIGFGLVATIVAFFFWHTISLSRSSRSSEHRAFGMGCTVAMIAVLIHSWVDFNMHIPANLLVMATLMGLVVAAKSGEGPAERRELRRGPKLALGLALIVVAGVGAWIAGRTALAYHYTSLGNDQKEILAWNDALDYYRRAVAVDPSFPEPYAKMGDVHRTQALWRLGDAHTGERRRLGEKAVAGYSQALDLNPLDSDVRLRLAATFETMRQYDRALEVYRSIFKYDPNNAFVYVRLGLALRHAGDDVQAAAAFEKAIRLGCADATARLNLEEIRRTASPKR